MIDPWCMSRLSGSHYLWWDTLLTPDKARRALVLPQLNVPGFAVPSWEGMEAAGGRGGGVGGRGGGVGWEREEGGGM